jgi:hypothetical protein
MERAWKPGTGWGKIQRCSDDFNLFPTDALIYAILLEKAQRQWPVVRGPLQVIILTGLIITGEKHKQRTTDN